MSLPVPSRTRLSIGGRPSTETLHLGGGLALGLVIALAVVAGEFVPAVIGTALLTLVFISIARPRLGAALRAIPGLSAIVVVPTGLIVLNVTAPAGVTVPMRLLGTAIVACGVLPLVIWHRYHELPIPLFPAICGIYVFYFGVPVFLTAQFSALSRGVPSGWIVPAQALALGGLVAMEVSYYISVNAARVRYAARTWRPTLSDQPASVWVVLGFFGLLVYAASRLVTVPATLSQISVLLGALTVFSAVQLYAARQLRRVSVVVTILWLVIIGGRVILGFGTGANNEALSILLAIGLAVATWRQRIPWIGVALAISAVLILQPIKVQFRSQSSAYGGPILKSSVAYLNQTTDYLGGGSGYQGIRPAYLTRFGFLSTLAAVVQQSPESVPYWHGTTYEPVLTKVIPRFLLPTKPQEDTGQTFGHRYGLLGTHDTQTSYNMPMLVELYANFGVLGTILGMAFFGWAYVAVQYFTLQRISPAFGIGSAVFVLSTLAYIESAFSFVFANAFYAAVAVYAVRLGLQIVQKREPFQVAQPSEGVTV